MKEIRGNIWDYHKKGHWIVITTNSNIKANGKAVMGAGIAQQAAMEFPDIPSILGILISTQGSRVHVLAGKDMITFPVKYKWWQKADMGLIELSCKQLVEATVQFNLEAPIYLVRPGCKLGRLDWKDVKPILEKYLDNRFIVVEQNP